MAVKAVPVVYAASARPSLYGAMVVVSALQAARLHNVTFAEPVFYLYRPEGQTEKAALPE